MCDFLHPGWIDPLYNPHFVCFDCRKHLRLRDEAVERYWATRAGYDITDRPSRRQVGAVCPDCRAELQTSYRVSHESWGAGRGAAGGEPLLVA